VPVAKASGGEWTSASNFSCTGRAKAAFIFLQPASPGHAKRALERLPACYAVTPRELLEGLLRAAHSAAVDRPMLVPNGQTDYYEGHLRLAKKSVTQ